MRLKVFFLDRDGIINKDIGYLHDIDKFEFVDGIVEVLQEIQKKGFKLIIVTNQSGIGRGYYSLAKYQLFNDLLIKKLKSVGINILDVFYCPHTPEDLCECRKPKPGLINMASSKYQIDKTKSWMLGDKISDIESANNASIYKTILFTNETLSKTSLFKPKYTFNSMVDILNLVKFIV